MALAPPAVRIPLPAPVALDLLQYAELLQPKLTWDKPKCPKLLQFRALVAVLVNYTFFCRGECGVSMQTGDLAVHDETITLFLRKVKGRTACTAAQLPLLQIPVASLPRLANLIATFSQGRQQLAAAGSFHLPEHFWALDPVEQGEQWTAATLSDWLALSCALVNHSPPPGFTWTSHSLRKGAASAANAINVVLTKIRYMGGWAKDSNVVHDYIDPTMAPTPAALVFFGHLLPP